MVGLVRFGVALAACFSVAVAGGVPGAQAAQARQVNERVFAFEPGGELTIKSQNGRITVEAWDRPEARVQITREVRAGDDERTAELIKELRADVTIAKGQIMIESKYPRRAESVGILDVLGQKVTALNIHYYVQVPAKTSLVLVTSNGEVRVRGISGEVTAQTVNGSIDVSSVTGHIAVSTTNGSIKLSGIHGSARAGTTNGGITAEFRRLDAGAGITLATVNGNVEVSLPGTLKGMIGAETTNGRVSIGYAIEKIGVSSSKVVVGKIGGGDGVAVQLRTTNGNVTVKKLA